MTRNCFKRAVMENGIPFRMTLPVSALLSSNDSETVEIKRSKYKTI